MLYIQLTKSFSVLFFFFLIIPSFCSPPPSSFSIMRDSSFSVEVTVVLMFCGERETKRKDVKKKKETMLLWEETRQLEAGGVKVWVTCLLPEHTDSSSHHSGPPG